MLCAGSGMLAFGIAGSLMSLGAIDFGLIVDSSVILVENAAHRLAEAAPDEATADVVRDAALEVRGPTMFGELIIMIVYLPILTLEGVEGRMFRPMALTVIFALAGSLVMSLTLIPALASFALPRRKGIGVGWMMKFIQWGYTRVLGLVLRLRVPVVLAAVGLLILGMVRARNLGGQFIPRLDEGALVINTVRLAGVDLTESARYGTSLEDLLEDTFPDEIQNAWTRTGTAQVATDPMGFEVSDLFVTLKPREEWTRATTQAQLVARIREVLEGMPGMRSIFTQPIEMRLGEMTAGIRSDLGIKIFGDDFDVLEAKAREASQLLGLIPGASDIQVEQLTGQPVLEVTVDREALSRYQIPAHIVLDLVESIGGRSVGEIREGQRRFDLVLKLDPQLSQDGRRLSRILITAPSGERVPLSRLAYVTERTRPSSIQREWQRRRILLQVNVSDRDLDGFVTDIKKVLGQHLDLPEGYHLEYGGQFEHLHRARARLAIVIPLALLLILILLRASTGNWSDSLIIFTGAPFAALGGIAALQLRDLPFSISAGVGFVAVCGVSMLNGLVLVARIRDGLAGGLDRDDAILDAGRQRIRPILMTALVAALGFVPMALNTGIGAEVQRPLATVVIGGVISDNLLTLLVLPALFSLFAWDGRPRTPAAN